MITRHVLLASLLVLVTACDTGKKETDEGDEPAGDAPAKKKGKSGSSGKSGSTGPLPAAAAARLRKLGEALGCNGKSYSGTKVWCHAVDYPKGRVPESSGTGVFFGMTINLKKGSDLAAAPTKTLHTSAMRLSGLDGEKGVILAVTPDNESEKKMLLSGATATIDVLDGKRAKVGIAKDLMDFISSLQPKFSVDHGDAEWIIRGDSNTSYLRRVGSRAWVAIEVPKAGGDDLFVTLLTDRT